VDLALFAELKRRRVFRALIAYGIVAFAVLQVIEPVMHGLHWPEAVLSYVVVALALGFPVVVTLAWIFDVRGGRIERTDPATARQAGLHPAVLVVAIAVLGAVPAALYWFAFRGDKPRPAVPAAVAATPSIAVLPFVNISGQKENEYFSDGITEELTNALANIEGLRVASRTAVYALRGKSEGVRQIGADLNVNTLLEGSVRREGNALRVTAQLISVSDGYHLWSKTYDRELKSIFAVEDEIARSIAGALQRKLIPMKQGTANTVAHDLYLRGRYLWNKRTREAIRQAAGYFQQAIREDPGYALAYAGLADALALQYDYEVPPVASVLPKARQAALKALDLDPDLAEAHASLGLVARYSYDYAGAVKEFQKALELRPGYAMARKWLGDELVIAGRLSEARAEYERALRDDPMSPIIINAVAEARLHHDRDFDGALELFRRALELDPAFPPARGGLAYLYCLQGNTDAALAEVDKLPHNPSTLQIFRAHILLKAGRRPEALAIVRDLEAGSPKKEFVSPTYLGGIWGELGEKDKAFAQLRKACDQRDPALLMVKIDPAYEQLRSDPRFKEVLRCVHLD